MVIKEFVDAYKAKKFMATKNGADERVEYLKSVLNVKEYIPFIATENLMMEAVKRGGDRQKIHEIIRKCSMEATTRMKEGAECDLLSRLAKEQEIGMVENELKALLNPQLYIGRCVEQVEEYIKTIKPILYGLERSKVEIDL